jgi:fatty acid-binding protein DegV
MLGRLAGVEVEHDLVVTTLGPVVGTHAGPGTVGVCYMLAAGPRGSDG